MPRSKHVVDTFCHRMFLTREKAGLTQHALANKIGVCKSRIGKWENGNQMPQLVFLRELCAALDVSADHLLGLD